MMKQIVAAIFFGALVTAAHADDSADASANFEHCSITPVDQVGFVETFTQPAECETACKETDGCDSWSFPPHSFDKSAPGQCKLIAGIFKQEESTSTFCGKV